MNRARLCKAATKKRVPVSDDDFESGSDPNDVDDFSASEDEWLPGKRKPGKSQTEDSDDNEDEEDDDEVSAGESDLDEIVESSKRGNQQPSKQPQKKKRLSPGTRDELYKRSKNYLKKDSKPPMLPLNTSVREFMKQFEFKGSTSLGTQNGRGKSNVRNDESDSSGDDHLIDPNKLDLNSKFFDKMEQNKPDAVVPQFDCNAGMRLSDSSDGEDRADHNIPSSIPTMAAKHLISKINESSSGFVNFTNMEDFTKKMEEAKNMLKNYQEKQEQKGDEKGDNISNLLALGETEVGTSPGKVVAVSRDEGMSEESDWEDVEEAKKSQNSQEQSDKYQITVEVETVKSKKKRWEEIEMELYIKRQINKVKRDNQMAYHKSSILCAIAGGRKFNELVNADAIRARLLSVMQSKECTLKGAANVKFVEQLIKWFKGNFQLMSEQLFPVREHSHQLKFTLALESFTRKVCCKRNYILMFLACLRATGAPCRLVISANVPPKRPAMKDLCPINERQLYDKFVNEFSKKGCLKEEPSLDTSQDIKSGLEEDADKTEQDSPIKTEEKNKGQSQQQVNQTEIKMESKTQTLLKPDKNDDPIKIVASDEGSEKQLKRSTRLSQTTKHDNENEIVPTKRTKSNSTNETTPSCENTSPPANKNSRKRTSLRNTSKPLATNSPSRSALNSLNIPQMDGAADLDTTPSTGPPTRQLRSRTKSNQKPADEASSVPFGKRKSNTPVAKDKTSQPGKVLKRKLYDKNQSMQNPIPAKTSRTGAKNKILSTTSSSSEAENDPPIPASLSPPLSKHHKIRQATAAAKVKPTPVESDFDDSDFELPGKSKSKKAKPPINKAKFETPEKKKPKASKTAKRKSKEHETEPVTGSGKTDLWIEFYSSKDKRWMAVDLFTGKIDCADYLTRHATSPISYVFGFDNENHIKDITPRYVQHWNTVSRKLRVDSKWLNVALKPFLKDKNDERDRLEDVELNKIDIDKPLPTTIAECKNHPLYVLKRHLLKFEALYPPDVPSLGFVRGEAIYARECLFVLQTREKWYKQGRVVKPFETAYKVVKCWKYDKAKNEWLKNQPCDIFGLWQTEEYDPPTAENGVVPRNEYGNVELFTPKMLPKKTVHLRLPGLNKVCRRLGIDCAPALTGFDKARMRMIPVYDGFVVCEEFGEQLVEEWYKQMEAEELREQEKYEKRVYGNWRRLIKGLLVRRKLQNKYNFDNL